MRLTEEQRARAATTKARKRRAMKPANRPDCERLLAALRREVPSRYRGLVNELANGSQRAAVKLHCLQCVGYVRQDVASCTSKVCPLAPFRPYQGGAESAEGGPGSDGEESD